MLCSICAHWCLTIHRIGGVCSVTKFTFSLSLCGQLQNLPIIKKRDCYFNIVEPTFFPFFCSSLGQKQYVLLLRIQTFVNCWRNFFDCKRSPPLPPPFKDEKKMFCLMKHALTYVMYCLITGCIRIQNCHTWWWLINSRKVVHQTKVQKSIFLLF